MSKFCCYFFLGNPTSKIVTGTTAYTWGLLIANHLDQSLWSTNQKYWAAVRSNLLHSFWEVHNLCCAFYQRQQRAQICAEKPISWDKQAHFDIFTINFTVWSHILSAGGDALTSLWSRVLLAWNSSFNLNPSHNHTTAGAHKLLH
jgi:hypothetical protein